jgi:RND family efflux transporter MFP subunit
MDAVAGTAVRGRRREAGRAWVWILALLVVVAGITTGGIFYLRRNAVQTITVQRGTVVQAFYATGTVRPNFEYAIKSKGQGNLVALLVREGSHVAKDQLLARIDDRQLHFAVEQLESQLKEAQAMAAENSPQHGELIAKLTEARSQYEIADRELARVQKMYEQNAATMADLDNTRRGHVQWANMIASLNAQVENWRIESANKVEVTQAQLSKAKADLADTEIHSPIDGVVLERYVEEKEVVALNQKLLLVANPQDLIMKAAVDEEDVARTEIGKTVDMQLYAFGDRVLQGKVFEILPTADPANKTYEVKVQFIDPPVKLRVGMTAELNFIENVRENTLVIPTSAIMDDHVYVPRGGKYEAVDVKVGARSLEKVEILGGLKEGDSIVADVKQVAPVKLPPVKAPVVPTRKGDVAEGG